MKAKIFAYITMIAVLSLVIVNNIFLDTKIGRIYNAVNEFDCKANNAPLEAVRLKENFEKSEIYISLTVSHDDLTNIEEGFAELAGALSVGEKEEAEIIKSRLKNSLLHLRRLSGFNIDGII